VARTLKDLFARIVGSIYLILVLIISIAISCNKHEEEPIDRIQTQEEKQIDSLNNLAWKYVNSDISLFYKYGAEALRASNQNNYLFGKCESLQTLGVYHYYTGVLDSALIWYQLALEKRKELGDSSLISGTLNNIGAVYEKKGELTQSLEYYIAGEEFIPLRNLAKKARINDNIGFVYTRLGNYSEALRYNQSAADLFGKVSPKTNAHVKNQLNKANIYELMSDSDLADSLYHDAAESFLIYGDTIFYGKTINNLGNSYLKQGKIDVALEFYLEALDKFQTSGYLAEMAGTEQNLGLLYQAKGEYGKAKTFFDNSILKWRNLNNSSKLAELLVSIGDLYLLQDDLSKAEKAFLKAESLSPLKLELKSKLYNSLFMTYAKRGMFYKSVPYQVKYKSITDSINLERIKWRNLEADFTRNKNRILLLEEEKNTALERSKKDKILRNFLMSIILFISLLTSLLYLNWNGKRKRIIAEKKAQEKQQEVEHLLKDQELASIRQVLEMQDKERKRIAQDLHDRLGSMLSMVKLHFQNTNKGIEELKKLNQEEYKKANKLLDQACDEVRKIAHNLMSGVLKNFGLIAAIEELKSTLENTGQYKVELLTHQFEERLSVDYESIIYRILQELISNIIRHANATEISFQFLMKKNLLQITVEDNGIGYNVEEVDSKGMGLKSIQSRLVSLNGTIDIDSYKNRGTSVIIEIPLNSKS
jgi:Signal transduction histidine kinase